MFSADSPSARLSALVRAALLVAALSPPATAQTQDPDPNGMLDGRTVGSAGGLAGVAEGPYYVRISVDGRSVAKGLMVLR